MLADTVTHDRMRELGVTVGTTYGTLFELYSDLSTPEGQKAEMVAAVAGQTRTTSTTVNAVKSAS